LAAVKVLPSDKIADRGSAGISRRQTPVLPKQFEDSAIWAISPEGGPELPVLESATVSRIYLSQPFNDGILLCARARGTVGPPPRSAFNFSIWRAKTS
jgi:hypothetical protein